MMTWFWIVLVLLYIISPYDLLPDAIPLRGWIDDIIAGFLLYRYLTRTFRARSAPNQGEEAGRKKERDANGSGVPPGEGTRPLSPHEVLGVAPDAGPDEIKAAFRRLAGQYHPDKVSHLGPEFQALAEKRFKEIQSAHDRLLQQRKS